MATLHGTYADMQALNPAANVGNEFFAVSMGEPAQRYTVVGGAWVSDTQAAITAVAAAPGYTRVKKTADTPNSSNVIWVTDPHLTFALLANTDYEFSFDVVFTSVALTTGLQLALTGPGSNLFAAEIRVPISKTAEVQARVRAYDDPALGTAVDAINVALLATIRGMIRVGATPGSLAVRFRSEINLSAVTLKQGSIGRLRAV